MSAKAPRKQRKEQGADLKVRAPCSCTWRIFFFFFGFCFFVVRIDGSMRGLSTAWMPEWSKGADLRSAGRKVRVGSNPTSGISWGISSIGRVPALQAGGTGIETLMLQGGRIFVFDARRGRSVRTQPPLRPRLDGRVVQGARLKFEYRKMRGFESHFKQARAFGLVV